MIASSVSFLWVLSNRAENIFDKRKSFCLSALTADVISSKLSQDFYARTGVESIVETQSNAFRFPPGCARVRACARLTQAFATSFVRKRDQLPRHLRFCLNDMISTLLLQCDSSWSKPLTMLACGRALKLPRTKGDWTNYSIACQTAVGCFTY